MAFNASIVYSNIKFLAKVSGVRLGDIESEAEASPGYLSRLGNREDDKATSAIVDILITASQKLHVSIDALLLRDFTTATESENKFVQLINKLTLETHEGKRVWIKQSEEVLDGRVPTEGVHPLAVQSKYDEDGPQNESYFLSRFDDSAKLDGSCYKTNLVSSAVFYIVRTAVPSEVGRWCSDTAYELYLYHNSHVVPLCNCRKKDSILFTLAEKLYEDAAAAAKIGGLSYAGNSLITEYLKS